MAEFPKRETDINTFSELLLSGLLAHPEVFPHADTAALEAARNSYLDAQNGYTEAMGLAALALERKRDALAALTATMRTALLQAEVSTAGAPSQLRLIGWGTRAEVNKRPPAQPRNLTATVGDRHVLHLAWRAPRWGEGGRVRSYAVERRAQQGGGAWGEWVLAAAPLTAEATLRKEPQGCPLEYRVHAVNNTGRSPASNTVQVIL